MCDARVSVVDHIAQARDLDIERFFHPQGGTASAADIDQGGFALQVGGMVAAYTAVGQFLPLHLAGNEHRSGTTLAHDQFIRRQSVDFQAASALQVCRQRFGLQCVYLDAASARNIDAAEILQTESTDEPGKRIKYCRRCEFACIAGKPAKKK